MAFIASQAIRNSISRPTNQVVCDMSDKGSMDRFSFKNKGIYKGQRNLQDHLTVANVASPLPVIAPPPEERSGTTGGRRHHVAWTSIPQERWEGELLVQGQIPLWLVSDDFNLIYIAEFPYTKYFFSFPKHSCFSNILVYIYPILFHLLAK